MAVRQRGAAAACGGGGVRIEAVALVEQGLEGQIAVETLRDFEEFEGAVFVSRRDGFFGDANAA